MMLLCLRKPLQNCACIAKVVTVLAIGRRVPICEIGFGDRLGRSGSAWKTGRVSAGRRDRQLRQVAHRHQRRNSWRSHSQLGALGATVGAAAPHPA